METIILSALNDNYSYLLIDQGHACVIDPAEATPVLNYLEQHALTLDLILNTHHHADHCGGNLALKAASGCAVWSSRADIPGIDRVLNDGEILAWQTHPIQILATPGHTRDSLCYHLPESTILFTGDTLFISGCGRLFEGTVEELWASFQKLLGLPDATQIYCGHNYSVENSRFAEAMQPGESFSARRVALETLASQGQPTVPSTLAQEKRTNLFLRSQNPAELGRWRAFKNRF